MMDMLVQQAAGEADRETDGALRGLAIGVVTDNKDPDGLARVRVRLPWQPDAQESFWARVAVPMALKNQGVYFLPSVGEEVLCGFEMGNLSHPCVIGCVWSGNLPPPQTNDDNKNDVRQIVTRADSELTFFDGDPPSIKLALADGKQLFMDKNGIVVKDENGNKFEIDSQSNSVSVVAQGELNLEGKTGVKIKSGGPAEFKSSATMTIKGALVQIN